MIGYAGDVTVTKGWKRRLALQSRNCVTAGSGEEPVRETYTCCSLPPHV